MVVKKLAYTISCFWKNYLVIFSTLEVILCDNLQSVMITIASLGKGPTVYFGTFRVSILIENLVGPKTLGDLNPLFYITGRC